MPRLRRVHFASVGYPDARLAPLTLDLRDADLRCASDSVLWLRNGGGKSSVLNLLFSVFRPSQSEFLGRHVEGQRRKLADYIKSKDLACVATEWEMASPDLLGEAPVRVIGQLLAWRGQQRSSDASRLQRAWFSFRADDELGLDALPVQGLAEPLDSLEAIKQWLRDRGRARPSREMVVEDAQGRWKRHLLDLRLDPELFGYQLKMNRREGAADELFKFGSSRQFIDFFLELVLDPTQANAVSANLEVLRDKLARRPVLTLERDFSAAAREALGPVCAANDAVAAAGAELERCDAKAGGLKGGLKEALERLQGQLSQARQGGEQLQAQQRQVSNEQRKLARWSEGLERLALELAVREAEASLDESEARLRNASGRLARAQACVPLRDLRAAERLVQEITRQLGIQQRRAEPERARLAAAGDALRAALAEQQGAMRGRADKVTAQLEACDEAIQQARAAQRAAERATARAEQRAQGLRQQLQQRDEERERLLKAGDLELREPAVEALARWQALAGELEARAQGCREELEQARSRQQDVQQRLQANGAALAAGRERLRRDRQAFEEALAWRARIEHLDVVVEFEERERADVFAKNLSPRLIAQAEAAEERVLRLRVDDAEDAREEESLRTRGLSPAPLDVERLMAHLRDHGVVAYSGWQYLADNVASEADKRALLACDPARFSGVLVDDGEALARVRELTGLERGLRSSVQISAAGLTAEHDPQLVVGPEGAAGFDHAAAVGAREQVVARRERRAREARGARELAERLRDAASQVRRFCAAWGDGRWTQAQERIQAQEQEVGALEQRAEALARELDAARQRERDVEQARREAELRLREVAGRAARLTAFVERWERRLEGLRGQLDEAQRQAAHARREAQRWSAEEAEQAQLRDGLREQLSEARRQLKRLGAERDAVRYFNHDATPSAEACDGGSLDELRAQYERRQKHFEEHFGDERLRGELSAHDAHRRVAQERLLQAMQGMERADLEAFDSTVGERLQEVLQEARDDERRAQQSRAAALHKLEQARAELAAHPPRRRDSADLPPGPAPVDAQTARRRAAALREQVTQLQERLRQLEEQATQLRARQQSLELELERRQGQLKRLDDACQPGAAAAQTLPEAEAELAALLDACIAQHRAARQALGAAEQRRRQAVEALRKVPLSPRFADFDSAWRQRLLDTDDVILERSSQWYAGLAERIGALEDELGSLEADRETLAQSLLGITEEAVRHLLELEKASRMPSDLRGWAGLSFVSVQLDVPQTDQDKRARLDPLLDELVESSHVPGGLELVQRAVDKYRGSKPVRVTILKPEAERRRQRVEIASMVNFSGGERLTAAVLLYCTLVHLRARRRGTREPSGNVLVLDNPIGTCSSVGLLELQREVARVMHTQLVYTTGVDDLAALAQLPNVVRLRNRHRNSRSGDQHVTVEGQVESVRVARRIEA